MVEGVLEEEMKRLLQHGWPAGEWREAGQPYAAFSVGCTL